MVVTEQEICNGQPAAQVRVLHLRPLGDGGPRIGVQISSKEEFILLDEKMGELSESARHTVEGVRRAVEGAKLPIVDF